MAALAQPKKGLLPAKLGCRDNQYVPVRIGQNVFGGAAEHESLDPRPLARADDDQGGLFVARLLLEAKDADRVACRECLDQGFVEKIALPLLALGARGRVDRLRCGLLPGRLRFRRHDRNLR
ncbi:hypothetical protein [Sphingosinicella humi]|uniref:hypothetical protein n=1 Tax=Allosphingosinicella humi TaxID=2068657 RepID=UPI003C75AD20